ncbi:MAG TPA: DUF1573 domain-containing protein, partial [Candidatus Altiarchaeales archaeon]|nr:DUF1573 domain-containing protein [Candidatus Altiarchaeales archaeon]HEX55283.1 DUF1573 domain-containing protein [Candidatus Altiarchaeales archaeon]
WQLGIFGGGPGAVNTAHGFSKIKVLEPSIKFDATADVLNFSVVNGAGTPITITAVTASGDCTAITLADTSLTPGETTWVAAGAGTSCSDLNSGDPFTVTLSITYQQKVATGTVSHTETGVIRGTAE